MPRLLEYAVLLFLLVFFFSSVRSISVTRLVEQGTKPIKSSWSKLGATVKRFGSFVIVSLDAGVRTNRASEAIRQLRVIGPKLALALGIFALGYFWRDHQLSTSLVLYTDVYIKAKVNDDHFVIQPARMPPLDSQLCNSIVDWKQGETLHSLKFEQKKGCKRVISYDRYVRGEQHAALQASRW